MDISLVPRTQLLCLALLLVLRCASLMVVEGAGCLNAPYKWVEAGNTVTINCGLNQSHGVDTENPHFWFKGHDNCDPSEFVRFGINNNDCEDGTSACEIGFSGHKNEWSTVICCTENGVARLEDAQYSDCYEIAVCPEVEMSVPLVVETGRPTSIYTKVTTKPLPLPLESPELVGLSVLNGPQINYTVSLIPPVAGTSEALESFYVFDFQIPLEALNNADKVLIIEPNLRVLPKGESCLTRSLETAVVPIRINTAAAITMATTNPTEPGTTEPDTSTEGLLPYCPQPDILGASVAAAFVIGAILSGIPITMICCLQVRRLKRTSESKKRPLPDRPAVAQPNTLAFRPPTSILDTTSHSSNGTYTATPTPIDNPDQRLLEGQTPNNPPMDNPMHPLHPQPYATTLDMEVMKVAHIEANGPAYPPDFKTQAKVFYDPVFSETMPTIHEMFSPGDEVGHLQVPSQSPRRCADYATHGNKIHLRTSPIEARV